MKNLFRRPVLFYWKYALQAYFQYVQHLGCFISDVKEREEMNGIYPETLSLLI